MHVIACFRRPNSSLIVQPRKPKGVNTTTNSPRGSTPPAAQGGQHHHRQPKGVNTTTTSPRGSTPLPAARLLHRQHMRGLRYTCEGVAAGLGRCPHEDGTAGPGTNDFHKVAPNLHKLAGVETPWVPAAHQAHHVSVTPRNSLRIALILGMLCCTMLGS